MRELTEEQEVWAQQLARTIQRLLNPSDRAKWLTFAPQELKPRILEIIKTNEAKK